MKKNCKRILGQIGDRLAAGRRFCRVQGRYAYPAGAYFCMCASSRALLHVGSLSLWDRQPSNAPPLLLSPAGLASRRGPHTKTHLGLCPKTPLPLNCGWIRTMRSIVRTAHRYAPKVAAGAFAPTALRCPKKSSRCSLARFFRPLRVLRLAASATGGARLRTPYPSPAAGEGVIEQIICKVSTIIPFYFTPPSSLCQGEIPYFVKPT